MIDTKTIGEISVPKQWKNLPISKLSNNGYPVYGANGIIGYYEEFNHEKPTIAVTCRGASCGNIHLTLPKSYITSNAMAIDHLNTSICDIEYLVYFLRFRGLADVISGAAQPQITRTNLEKIKIPLPKIDDQIRIATLLSKVESLIAKRKRSIADLDELLKSTFLEMFGSFSDNKNGYSFEKLDIFITHITSGGRGWAKYYSESGKRFIRSLDVQMNKIGDDDVAYVNPPKNKEAKRTKIKSGDVLLTITGSKIGRVCFVPKGFEEAYISQHVAIIRTKGINSVYLSYYLSMPNSGQLIIQRKQYGQAKPGLNLDQIKNFEILNAPPAAQDKFATIVEKVERLKEKYQKSLNDLETLYGALSQKAFKGELDLSRIPITVALKPKDITTGVPQVGEPVVTVQDKPDKTPEAREQILHRLFNGFISGAKNGALSLDDFWPEAEEKFMDLMDEDAPPLGVADYDRVRDWLFDMLAQGKVAQVFNAQENRMEIRSVS